MDTERQKAGGTRQNGTLQKNGLAVGGGGADSAVVAAAAGEMMQKV